MAEMAMAAKSLANLAMKNINTELALACERPAS